METSPPQAELAPRVREALALVGEGYTSKEIARRMGDISPHTVNEYISKGVRALGASTRQEAARLLREKGVPSNGTPEPLGGEPPTLVPMPPPVVSNAPDRSETSDRQGALPFLRNGRRNNDLTTVQRLIWVLVLTIAFPIVIALTLNGLQVLQEITRGMFP